MDLSHSSYPTDNFKLVYSPRTTYDSLKLYEDKIYNQLLQSFDPKTFIILRRHFKEHLGSITKDLFICILKRHLSLSNLEIKNKNKLIIKLLSKLFEEIDINSKGVINWNEFSNFLVNFNGGKKIQKYYLNKYYKSKININPIEKIDENENEELNFHNNNKDKVGYCFYIEKFRFLGLIKEGNSKIIFFNTETNNRLKLEIDLSSIQQEVDKHALYELDEIVENMLEKREEEYLNHKAILEEKMRKLMIKRNKRYQSNSKEKYNGSYEQKTIETENDKQKSKLNKSTNINEMITDKQNNKRNILSYKNFNNISNKFKKKSYYIATTLFLDEYNLLLISLTDNIISAWKYKEKEENFENVNLINHNIENVYNKKKCVFEKEEILIPLLMTENTQYCMCFDQLSNYLYTGQTDGKILKWDITLNKPILILDINDFSEKNDLILPKLENPNNAYQKETKDIALKKGQNDFNKILKSLPEKKRNMISCLIFITPLKILCSAHYNGLIILWDIVYNRPKRIYTDQKTGIYQILYNYNMNHIYTCGFSHDIFVYDPYIDSEAIYRLKGHKSSINSIALIKENNELISIDISGIIKIWDITNYYNFQTINTNDSTLLKVNNINKREEIVNKVYKKKISADIHIQTFPDLSKFLVYGKKFLLFEKGNSFNLSLCDDFKIIGCFYNPKTNNIITISHKKIQFWNILNGKLVKIFRDLMSDIKPNLQDNNQLYENENNISIDYDITSFSYDINYKKLYLGDSFGRIKSFNLETGDFIKQFESHKTEIVDLLYTFKYDYLITCSSDLIIKFHKDKDQIKENNKSIREFELIYEKMKIKIESKVNKIILRKMILNEDKGILIICLSCGFIKELNIELFKFINELDCLNINFAHAKNFALITSAEYIKDIDMLFIALDNYSKKFVALKNNKFFNELRGKDIILNDNKINDNNYNIDNNNKSKKNIIQCCYYDIKTHKIIIGNTFGEITFYDLTELCNYFFSSEKYFENGIGNIVKNEINLEILLKIKISNEPIISIFTHEILNPEILIIISLDKNAQLIDFNSGKIIDSLKQISINDAPFPIAVKYSINTPFVKFEKSKEDVQINSPEKEDNNYRLLTIPNECENRVERMKKKFPFIIYRKDAKFEKKPIKIKQKGINGINRKEDLIKESYSVLIETVKEKLRQPKFSKEIPEDKSTLWKYEINLNKLKEIEEENFLKIEENVKKKEEEINITEKDFIQFRIQDKNYIPKYINDLSMDKKDRLKLIISKKLKDVNLSYSKKELIKTEKKKISKEKEAKGISINNILSSFNNKKDVNIFITPIRPIKTNIIWDNQNKEKNELPIIMEKKSEDQKNKNIIKFNNNMKIINRNKISHSPSRYINNFKSEIFNYVHMSKEDKFKEYKIQFDEKLNEIKKPMEQFKFRKKNLNI